ncbi:MAG TPA: VWA domain-containing protein, partial [Longimicrobiales bacterium]|nr:VWA domain-containing protein [Longimicrobiales bacterium]
MGFLSPLFLLAAAAVAVPLFLHLAHRSRGRRRPFPALRYLRRTERDHASRIRLRQLLILALRILAVLLLVLAGARLFLRGAGEEHEPTAVAVVLDNSLSSGVILGEERLLDDLKRRALETVDRATAEDRVWVVRAGEPWDVPLPGSADELRRRIRATEPTGAAVSLPGAVAEARALVAGAGLPGAEVHLLTDLQASGLDTPETPGAPGPDPPGVIVYSPAAAPPGNRWIDAVEVGGGLPPLADQRTEIAVRVAGRGTESGESGDTVRVRLILDERVAAALDAEVGSTVLLPAGPFPPGELRGLAELDPDPLRADDRRHFIVPVRPPPR